jgi:hypothetical protein
MLLKEHIQCNKYGIGCIHAIPPKGGCDTRKVDCPFYISKKAIEFQKELVEDHEEREQLYRRG